MQVMILALFLSWGWFEDLIPIEITLLFLFIKDTGISLVSDIYLFLFIKVYVYFISDISIHSSLYFISENLYQFFFGSFCLKAITML